MDIERIREGYLPKRVKILFVGESPPVRGNFFYLGDDFTNHTQKAFEEALGDEFDTFIDFLCAFREMGCFLDDISHEPVNDMENVERENVLQECTGQCAERLSIYSPDIIVVTPKQIRDHINAAILIAGLQVIPCHLLPYPAWNRNNIGNYISQLTEILKDALDAGIICPPMR